MIISVATLITSGSVTGVAAATAAAPTCENNLATTVGTDGPDHLIGSAARHEVFVGLGGDDLVDGDLAGDIVCGGDGNDTITSNAALVALGEVGNDLITLGPNDAIYDVARLEGGDGGDELVNQSSGYLDLIGGAGNDRLIAGPSAFFPYLEPGPGNDYVHGGPNGATLVYTRETSRVLVDLAVGYALSGGHDILLNIRDVFGSAYNDVLIGDEDDNAIYGNAGVDYLAGQGGDDTLNAAGTLIGGLDNDLLSDSTSEQSVDDAFNGGAGDDTVDFSYTQASVTVDLGAGTAIGLGSGTDSVSGIENVIGTRDYEDTITGDDNDNQIEGLGGSDDLFGGDGNDKTYGQSGNDHLDGGPGDDMLNGGNQTDTCLNGELVSACEA